MHTYSIKGTLPIVGDIRFTFSGLFKDPLVALIRCNFPHQPVPKSESIQSEQGSEEGKEIKPCFCISNSLLPPHGIGYTEQDFPERKK